MSHDRIPRLVHAGDSSIRPWRRELVADWLRANGIDPAHVCSDATITILPMPCAVAVSGEEPWQIHVIVFRQYFVGPDGKKELHFITRRPVTFERTVPLSTPFPADLTPGDEGARHGQGQEPEVEPVEEGQRPPQHQERAEADE